MALSASLVWEIRATGSDSNGGAFRAGGTGTDYSQQDVAQVSYTDLAIDASDPAKVTSAATPFTAAHVHNTIKVIAGSGFTGGRYEVVSVTSGVATLDRAVGTVGAAGGAGNLGGCLASLGELAGAMVTSNKAFLRSGTYTLPATATFSAASVAGAYSPLLTSLVGYYQTRGDLGPNSAQNAYRPVIQPGTSTITDLLLFSNAGWSVENLAIQAGAGAYARGIRHAGNFQVHVVNCKVSGFSMVSGTTGYGITVGTCYNISFCEVMGGAATAAAGINAGSQGQVHNNHVHDNACPGIVISATSAHGGNAFANLVCNNTGGGSDGIQASGGVVLVRNTCHGNGRHGIYLSNFFPSSSTVKGNLLTGNGGFGLSLPTAGTPARFEWDGNAFHGNVSGTRNNLDDGNPAGGTSAFPINAVGRYVNALDLTLAASPYVNAAAGDYRLNGTAGGGGTARGMGVPRAWPGSAATGCPDFGAIQAQQSISFMGF